MERAMVVTNESLEERGEEKEDDGEKYCRLAGVKVIKPLHTLEKYKCEHYTRKCKILVS